MWKKENGNWTLEENYIDTNYISTDIDDEKSSYTIDDLINLNKIPSLLLD